MENVAITQVTPEISTETLAALLRARVPMHLFDARPLRVGQPQIQGALHLVSESTEDAIRLLLPDKSDFIVTYCGGPKCDASQRLADRLRSLGYTNVVRYRLGFEGWTEAGLPVENG